MSDPQQPTPKYLSIDEMVIGHPANKTNQGSPALNSDLPVDWTPVATEVLPTVDTDGLVQLVASIQLSNDGPRPQEQTA